jgi:hypothetical protein
MARPRKNDPRPLLQPLVADFARNLASAVERATIDRIVGLLGEIDGARASNGGRARKRSLASCYYPGCKNVAAPRFGMFCAAVHKNLPKAEKEKYRAQRQAGQPAGKSARA